MSERPARARGAAHVGCSGWVYRDWRGAVYPESLPQARWLGEYARRFGTVETNSTFYRLPTERAVRAWAEQVPDGFVFAVKVGAFGTHRKKLRDPESWLARHIERARLLGPKLGPNLVQLPPRWGRDARRLDELLAVAPKDVRWAVEVRDPSWLHADVYRVLERHGAALCLHDLIEDHPIMLTTGWTYVRFHGPAAVDRYEGRYGARRLRPWARRLDAMLRDGCDAYCYFNNDHHAHAVHDATWLARQLT